MDTRDLIIILKAVPETRLRIFPLARDLIDESGKIDPAKVAFHQKELTEAVEEAKAYSAETNEAVRCLREMDQS
jgi:hypothetical protein